MTLNEWVELHRRDLVVEAPDRSTIAELREVADRELRDAEAVVSSEGVLTHAHNVCLAIAAAALSAGGFRVRRGTADHHWRLVESLEVTLGLSPRRIRELQEYRKKRSRAVYERTGIVTDTEASAALAAARRLQTEFTEWLAARYPGLFSG